ncbi:MAG: alanine--tRNA ligase [Clostridiales bacterium]|nr:alanine--tRNA ligase [Candidatus Coliplasma caballi]
MQSQSLNVLRKKYLEFFESKGHLKMDSFSLVPQDDNSLLLINAGMAPLKKYFTGEKVPPRKRVTTCQKCVRTLDIDNVGKTARHGTFFEMLGNFSFGDYFKSEAIPWAWEFLTKVLEIPENRLYPSVYLEDDEAIEIWEKVGVPKERITRLGKDDNFWEIGSGPCGPCSEIYFDRGEKYGCGKATCGVGCDCDRFIEIWNIVFTQFEGDGNGNYTRLAHPNIDTGMGLERLACVMQDVNNLFEVDTIRNIMLKVCEMAGVKYDASASDKDVSLRVITDHIRTATFLISDGVLPSNEGRGYILRRVLRRAARHGRLLGIKGAFLSTLCDTVIHESGEAYPELVARADYIRKIIGIEEDRFNQTLDAGLGILNKMIAETQKAGKDTVAGEDLFKLYDTFGFPIDLTKETLAEKGLSADEDAFKALMQEQKKRAREARAALGDMSWTDDSVGGIDKTRPTSFEGYTENKTASVIINIVAGGEPASVLNGGKAVVVLDKTPFYAEMGGQVADTGVIRQDGGVFRVENVKKTAEGVYLHFGTLEEGVLTVDAPCEAEIDAERRTAIARNHSSVHLLQAALREVLGTHVQQAGSYVDEQKARFDFTHPTALTAEELLQVENRVNEVILQGLPVVTDVMSQQEAVASGAMALFGEKYGEFVRVVKMGDFSKELCGGTHIDNIARIGLFRILTETSVAAGVRRIEACTGLNSLALLRDEKNQLGELASALKANGTEEAIRKAEQLQAENKGLRKELDSIRLQALSGELEASVKGAAPVGALRLATASFDGQPMDALRGAVDNLVNQNPDLVLVVGTVNEGKVQLVAGCGKTAVAAKAHCGNILKSISPMVGGGGGGRPDSATSGGKDPSGLANALAAVKDVLAGQIG